MKNEPETQSSLNQDQLSAHLHQSEVPHTFAGEKEKGRVVGAVSALGAIGLGLGIGVADRLNQVDSSHRESEKKGEILIVDSNGESTTRPLQENPQDESIVIPG